MDVERAELRTGSVVWDPEPLDRRDVSMAIGGISESEGRLIVGFTFFARFGKMSHIEITGDAYISASESELKKLREDKDTQQRFKDEISSLVGYYCMSSATLLASAFNLPAPILPPKVKLE